MAELRTLALVGSESLLGREVRDIVATGAPGIELRLIAADDEESGVLTRVGDEPAMVTGLTAENLSDVRAIILAGSAESSRKALELAGDPPDTAIIDLTFAAEELPDARLRAPVLEAETEDALDAGVHVIAHPAAIALALFLRRLETNDPVRRAVVQIFAPASEHGTKGVRGTPAADRQPAFLQAAAASRVRYPGRFQPAGALRRGGPGAAGRNGAAHRAPPGHPARLAGRGRGRAHALAAADSGAGVSRLQFLGVGGV